MQRQRLNSADPRDIAEYVDSGLDMLERRITATIERQMEQQRAWLEQAFPGGDMARHKLAHEEMMEAEADRRSLRKSLIEKGAFGLLTAIVAFNWEALKMFVREVFK